jgi:hypothetical protein
MKRGRSTMPTTAERKSWIESSLVSVRQMTPAPKRRWLRFLPVGIEFPREPLWGAGFILLAYSALQYRSIH